MNTYEQKLINIVKWLEDNQPDVFRRGLWDALTNYDPPVFLCHIEFGNAAMLSNSDLSAALRKIADQINNDYVEGSVKDANGNTCGSFYCPDFDKINKEQAI
jgi:hypothetical protein